MFQSSIHKIIARATRDTIQTAIFTISLRLGIKLKSIVIGVHKYWQEFFFEFSTSSYFTIRIYYFSWIFTHLDRSHLKLQSSGPQSQDLLPDTQRQAHRGALIKDHKGFHYQHLVRSELTTSINHCDF